MLSKCALFIGSVFFLTNQCFAQVDLSKYEIGLNAGAYIYQGDLSPSDYGSFRTPGFALGLQVSRILTPAFSLRAELNFGTVRGDDAAYAKPEWRQQRNFAFRTGITEGSVSATWTPLTGKQRIKPYAFVGAGIALPRTTRSYANFNPEYFAGESLGEKLDEDLATPLPKLLPVIPMGVGVRVAVSDRISIAPEASFRYIASDYLDGYSISGNPARRDQYFKYSIGIIYSFRKKTDYDCPPVRSLH